MVYARTSDYSSYLLEYKYILVLRVLVHECYICTPYVYMKACTCTTGTSTRNPETSILHTPHAFESPQIDLHPCSCAMSVPQVNASIGRKPPARNAASTMAADGDYCRFVSVDIPLPIPPARRAPVLPTCTPVHAAHTDPGLRRRFGDEIIQHHI